MRRQAAWVCGRGCHRDLDTSPASLSDFAVSLSVLERDRALDELTTADARIAVAAAGRCISLLALAWMSLVKTTTRSRAQVHPSFRSFGDSFISGHMKWDYASIGTSLPMSLPDLALS